MLGCGWVLWFSDFGVLVLISLAPVWKFRLCGFGGFASLCSLRCFSYFRGWDVAFGLVRDGILVKFAVSDEFCVCGGFVGFCDLLDLV